MNKEIGKEAFAEAFKDAKVTTIGRCGHLLRNTTAALAVASTLVMSGCSTVPQGAEVHDAVSNGQLKTLPAAERHDILKGQQSGVYQNPMNGDEVITLSFKGDPMAEEKIRQDFETLGAGEGHYTFMQGLDGLVSLSGYYGGEDGKQAYHVQNPFSSENINYIVMNESSMYGPMTNNEPLADKNDYEGYFAHHVLIHEIMHGAQQMSLADLAQSTIGKKQLVMMENGADVGAAISTVQLMVSQGEPESVVMDYLNKVTEQGRGELVRHRVSEHVQTHVSGEALGFVSKWYQQDPESLLSLSPEQIIEVSEQIGDAVVDLDYAPAIKDKIRSEMGYAIEESVDALMSVHHLSHRDPDKLERWFNQMEEKLDRGTLTPLDQLIFSTMLELKDQIPEMTPSEMKELSVNMLYDHLSKGNTEIFIYTLEGQQFLAEMDLKDVPQLEHLVLENLLTSGYQVSIELPEVSPALAEKLTYVQPLVEQAPQELELETPTQRPKPR